MPKLKKLPKAVVDKIGAAVDSLFDKVKLRLLGPRLMPKRLYITYSREKSLPGLYEAAHIEERGIPDKEHLDQLLRTAGNYIDSLRHKAKAKTVVAVQAWMQKPGADVHTVLGGELADLYGSLKSEVHRVVDSEAQNVRNVGAMEGIARANASMGIEDPWVFFVVVRDEHLCEECRKLHLMPDGVTPRLWRLSEIGHGYHERGEDHPKVGGLHPHCRCSMSTLMPGFGFDKVGMVVWKGDKHSESDKQR